MLVFLREYGVDRLWCFLECMVFLWQCYVSEINIFSQPVKTGLVGVDQCEGINVCLNQGLKVQLLCHWLNYSILFTGILWNSTESRGYSLGRIANIWDLLLWKFLVVWVRLFI